MVYDSGGEEEEFHNFEEVFIRPGECEFDNRGLRDALRLYVSVDPGVEV